MTTSERFVTKLCRQSFLSPWTHANPERRPVKTRPELCDVLVAFESSVILFSVKESSSKRGQDPKTAWSRWDREAVKNSAKQLQGAERWLRKGGAVVESDGCTPVIVPGAAHIEISGSQLPLDLRVKLRSWLYLTRRGRLIFLMKYRCQSFSLNSTR